MFSKILPPTYRKAFSIIPASYSRPNFSLNVTQHQRTGLLALFLDYLLSAEERHLLETCRLVCRTWEWQYARCLSGCPYPTSSVGHRSGSTNQGSWDPVTTRNATYRDGLTALVLHGVVWFLIDGKWQKQSSDLWAWQFQRSSHGTWIWVPQVLQTFI